MSISSWNVTKRNDEGKILILEENFYLFSLVVEDRRSEGGDGEIYCVFF